MLFNSQIFVFVFLPIVLIVYYTCNHYRKYTWSKIFLLVASLVFYGYQTPAYLILLVSSICINYMIYRILMNTKLIQQNGFKRLILLIGLLLNLGSIFYFKYYNFFMGNINLVFKTDFRLIQVLLPLGISFFTFQQVSFLVDTYRGEVDEYPFLDYSLFVAFFPQLIAGPIVLHKDLIPQFTDEKRFHPDSERILKGVRYFVIGLFKKTIVADRLSLLVTCGYENHSMLSSWGALLVVIAYTLQIYFDFSGYSDMAIGLGKMVGFDLPINFNEPYKAISISDFWKRWHITMTRFFTQYVYIPLGGSRKGLVRTCINTMIVFGLSGLWHGAGWTFIIWGLLHGIALVFYRVCRKWLDEIPKIISGAVTFAYVNIAWVFFRAEYFTQAKNVLICLIKGGMERSSQGLYEAFTGSNLVSLLSLLCSSEQMTNMIVMVVTIVGMLVILLVTFMAPSSHKIAARKRIGRYEGVVLGIMFVLSVMTFMNVSEFLYFNF